MKRESFSGRQRCRHWLPLITHQLRMRHLHQVIGINLSPTRENQLYFTLHLTSMSAPFYTSEKLRGPNSKWAEIDEKSLTNSTATAVVLRIWKHTASNDKDTIISTWGVNFSGLVYIGNKISDIRPLDFQNNSLIFYLHGGYFTSFDAIRTESSARFSSLINTSGDGQVVCRRACIKNSNRSVVSSYRIAELRRLHTLQILIKNTSSDVQVIKDKIESKCGSSESCEEHLIKPAISYPPSKIKYAPQLLTMNSLYKMLNEKPTKVERLKMATFNKNIELVRFKNRLLSQEMDRKLASMRRMKDIHSSLTEQNEEKNLQIMDNYHSLNKETEKLKNYKTTVLHQKEMLSQTSNQLLHRRKQLLKQLLFIYPITCETGVKYLVHGIYLPNSDILSDCSDMGLSVALGYVAHIQKMCSIILQTPLRYPVTHFGSRSTIRDNISPLVNDADREFPLFTRGKEKMQFTYAVYLLNKNIAQLRWLFFMHTTDLRATLPNLYTFILSNKTYIQEHVWVSQNKSSDRPEGKTLRIVQQPTIATNANTSPLRSNSSDTQILGSAESKELRNKSQVTKKNKMPHKCVSENDVLAVAESFQNSRMFPIFPENSSPSDGSDVVPADLDVEIHVHESTNCYGDRDLQRVSSIEEGKDMLEVSFKLEDSEEKMHSLKISQGNLRGPAKSVHVNSKNKLKKFASRSVDSYAGEEPCNCVEIKRRTRSEPYLLSAVHEEERNLPVFQQKFLEDWLNSGSSFIHSEENL